MNSTIYKLPLLFVLLLWPGMAMASKNFALSNTDALIILFILFGLPALLISNLITSLCNTGWKRRRIRLYNMIVTGLLGLLIIPIAVAWPAAAALAFSGLVLQVWVIYLSIPKQPTDHAQTEI